MMPQMVAANFGLPMTPLAFEFGKVQTVFWVAARNENLQCKNL